MLMPTAAIQRDVSVLLLAGSVLMAVRMYGNGLWRQYPVFFAYFLFRIPNSAWPLLVNDESLTYFWLFLITSPICVVFYVLLVAELYRLILARYRGLDTVGRWAMYAATLVSVLVSIAALLPHFTPTMPQSSKHLGYEFALERGIDFSLVLFILLLLLFLSRFPISLSRNVAVHAAIFSVYFLTAALGLMLRALWGISLSAEVNLFLSCASLVCVAAWIFLLTPAGEAARARVPLLGSGDEERILRELDAVNSALLRASRRI